MVEKATLDPIQSLLEPSLIGAVKCFSVLPSVSSIKSSFFSNLICWGEAWRFDLPFDGVQLAAMGLKSPQKRGGEWKLVR